MYTCLTITVTFVANFHGKFSPFNNLITSSLITTNSGYAIIQLKDNNIQELWNVPISKSPSHFPPDMHTHMYMHARAVSVHVISDPAPPLITWKLTRMMIQRRGDPVPPINRLIDGTPLVCPRLLRHALLSRC